MASTLLEALLKNESGGKNVTNVNATTSSGRARGYFQITDGTWKEFGGDKYAPTALEASYDQQADIASKIPLKRWDESTVALMRATGRPINVNATLGENLAMNKEAFANANVAGSLNGLRHVGGAGSGKNYFADDDTTGGAAGNTLYGGGGGGGQYTLQPEGDKTKPKTWNEALGAGLQDIGKNIQAPSFKPSGQQVVDFTSAQATPSVYRPQLQPTMVQTGMGGMGGGGGDIRQLLAQLMAQRGMG